MLWVSHWSMTPASAARRGDGGQDGVVEVPRVVLPLDRAGVPRALDKGRRWWGRRGDAARAGAEPARKGQTGGTCRAGWDKREGARRRVPRGITLETVGGDTQRRTQCCG